MSTRMDGLYEFVQKHVIPSLKLSENLEHVVEIATSVIRLISKLIGDEEQVNSDEAVQNSFLNFARKNAKRLAEWIVHAVEEGITSLKQYLDRNPKLLNVFKDSIWKVTAAKGTFRASGKFAAMYGAKLAAKEVTKLPAKAAISSFINPGGIVADVGQTALELGGKPRTGMLVGAAGNALSGAVTGAMIGGPVGAAAGAAVCLGIWGIGELAGKVLQSE